MLSQTVIIVRYNEINDKQDEVIIYPQQQSQSSNLLIGPVQELKSVPFSTPSYSPVSPSLSSPPLPYPSYSGQ